MIIKDVVYGVFEINEPVLIELITSPTVERLKGISQQGIPQEYYNRKIFSRFEHSIGVFLLLRKIGAELPEQVAGLLHDISHTAFSHVIDWVIGDPTKEDHQDNIFPEVLNKSEIPNILRKYDIDVQKISDLESFQLLEREAPSLCADRIDYTLRELVDLGYEQDVKQIVGDLSEKNRQIVFLSTNSAEKFGRHYAKLQREHWGGNDARARYYVLAGVLRRAIHNNFISIDDFSKTDDEIIDALLGTGDTEIADGLKKLRNGFMIKETDGSTGFEVKKKFRHIDPEVSIGEEIKKFSEISEKYKNFIALEKEHSQKNIYIEIRPIS